MPDERASGMILFRNHTAGRQYLVIRNSIGGHWGFPKGRLEPGEDEMGAALREVAEEVRICRPRVQPGYTERLSYQFVRDREVVCKTVTLFLAASDEAGSLEGDEVEAMDWLPLSDALNRLTHAEQRAALLRAEAHLQAQGPHQGE